MNIKVNIEIDVPFRHYDNKKLNQKADKHIRKWIKDTLKHELAYIPLYVEKDKDGAYIEDCTQRTKIKVT